MTVSTFTQSDYSDVLQTGSIFPTNIDKCIAVMKRIGAAFAPHAQTVPNMTVRVDAGALLSGATLTEVAAQSTGAITAPGSNSRIDRVVIDSTTGVVSVITGVASASPAVPALTSGKLPICQVLLTSSSTSIANSMITDERASVTPAPASAGSTRQTQLYAPLDSSGRNATLSAGAGLNFNVDGTPTNVVISFAAGDLDYKTTLTADASNQGSLAANNTNYIYCDYVDSATVTWGSGLIQRQEGDTFDRSKNAICNFEGTNGATTTTDDFGSTVTLSNASIDTSTSKFGSSALKIVSTAGTCDIGAGPLCPDSWTFETFFKKASAVTAYNVMNPTGVGIRIGYNDGGTDGKYSLYMSDQPASNTIVPGTKTTNAFNSTSTYDHLAVCRDKLAGKYYLYVNGVKEIEVTSALVAIFASAIRLGSSSASPNGSWFDGTRFVQGCLYPNGTTFTPPVAAPAVTDQKVTFTCIPEMKTYEVTSASASAGTNPGMTAKNRVFMGEQDTSTVVTATRNYALQGRFVSALTAMPAVSTATSANHYIGSSLVKARVRLVNVTAEAGFSPGDVVENWGGYNGSVSYPPQVLVTSLTVGTVRLSSSDVVQNKSTGGSVNITPANWKYQFIAARDF